MLKWCHFSLLGKQFVSYSSSGRRGFSPISVAPWASDRFDSSRRTWQCGHNRSLHKERKNTATCDPDIFWNTAKMNLNDIDAPYSAIYGRKIELKILIRFSSICEWMNELKSNRTFSPQSSSLCQDAPAKMEVSVNAICWQKKKRRFPAVEFNLIEWTSQLAPMKK